MRLPIIFCQGATIPAKGLLLVAFLAATGCRTTPVPMDDAAKRQMLELLMPSRIEIVEPFTRVKSFDDDDEPDGIEVLLQAVNALDNPGLMIAGDVRIELYRHIPASGNRRGERLETWQLQIADPDDQKTYWNEITQMYEFQLGMDSRGLPSDPTYVLLVTYNSPLGDHHTDECLIERPTLGIPLGSQK